MIQITIWCHKHLELWVAEACIRFSLLSLSMTFEQNLVLRCLCALWSHFHFAIETFIEGNSDIIHSVLSSCGKTIKSQQKDAFPQTWHETTNSCREDL